ncbi:MAG: transposase [Candidatus Contendobacter sp.]|nr:transposase [Candidatus Contendobacter sp.]
MPARRGRPGQALSPNQALGRSGGFSTKIHFVVNGIGKSLRMLLTPDQAADVPQAPLLFAQHFYRFCPVIDKAYDTDAVLAFFTSQGTIPVIPPKANRVLQRDYHRPLYKERNQIECFIGRIK